MVRAILTVAGFIATAMCAYHFGQEEVELRWAQDREHSLIQQIENLQRKDHEIAKLQQSISINPSLQAALETNLQPEKVNKMTLTKG